MGFYKKLMKKAFSLFILVAFKMIYLKAMVSRCKQMAKSMLASGRKERNMDKVSSLGQMDVFIKVNTKMTREMGMGYFLFQMEESITDTGGKGTNMEKEHFTTLMEQKYKASGKKVSKYQMMQ